MAVTITKSTTVKTLIIVDEEQVLEIVREWFLAKRGVEFGKNDLEFHELYEGSHGNVRIMFEERTEPEVLTS